MGNKEWENYLRDILGEFKSEGETPHWDDFSRQYTPEGDPETGPDQLADEALRETLSNYSPLGEINGWDRIEASLDEADKAFDEEVRHKIRHYQAPPDPHSWTLFLKHFTSHKLLRAKLITLKVLESAAVVLLIITVLHLGQIGKLPSLNPLAEEMQTSGSEPTGNIGGQEVNKNQNTHPATTSIEHATSALNESGTVASANSIDAVETHTKANSAQPHSSVGSRNNTDVNLSSGAATGIHTILEDYSSGLLREPLSDIAVPIAPAPVALEIEKEDQEATSEIVESLSPVHISTITQSLAPRFIALEEPKVNPVPYPTFVKALDKTYLEFGMLAQVDYNQLKMPEDRLYNGGKQIVFPLQGITSPGYGAGFTLALGHTRWAIEAGLIYSAKSFRPGRELTVGSVVDHSNVEFEAMRMQLISATAAIQVPL